MRHRGTDRQTEEGRAGLPPPPTTTPVDCLTHTHLRGHRQHGSKARLTKRGRRRPHFERAWAGRGAPSDANAVMQHPTRVPWLIVLNDAAVPPTSFFCFYSNTLNPYSGSAVGFLMTVRLFPTAAAGRFFLSCVFFFPK